MRQELSEAEALAALQAIAGRVAAIAARTQADAAAADLRRSTGDLRHAAARLATARRGATMTDGQREAGTRAALSVVVGGKRDAQELAALRGIADKTAAMAARAEQMGAVAAGLRRTTRAMQFRRLAGEVRALGQRIEREADYDAGKLRAYAVGLENRAEMLEGRPL